MSQIPPLIFFLSISAILIWLGTISFFLYRTIVHYNKLGRGTTKQNLGSLLEKVLTEKEMAKKDIAMIMLRCDKIEKEGLLHAQKIGLLRFNPFADTGGDQSFIVAILNGRDDGVLLSSLHGRAGTRWYAKKVREGKGVDHELSEEEKTAIKKARTIN